MNIFVRFEGVFCLPGIKNVIVTYGTSMSIEMKSHKQSMQLKIIDDLLAGFDVVSDLLTLPPYAGPRHNFEYHMARKEWDRIYGDEVKKKRALREMRKKKWIADRKKGDEVIVKIHCDAVVGSLKERIMKKKTRLSRERICLLSFDFPIGATKARNQWRGLIRRLGLKKEQLSLYSSYFDVTDELMALVKILGAEKWIRIFVAEEKCSTS